MESFAIIGSGLAGLTLANLLNKKNKVLVFDKSRGVGGRLATRRNGEYFFDHGAQFFTAKKNEFIDFIRPLIDKEVIQRWDARFAEFEGDKIVNSYRWSEEYPHYVGSPNMNSIAKFLSKNINIMKETKIVKIEKSKCNSFWNLIDQSGNERSFEWVIINVPPIQALDLLPNNFQYISEVKNKKMLGCYSLMLGFEKKIDLPFDSALIRDLDISWISVNSSKPNRLSNFTLVVNSTNSWAEKNLETNKNKVIDSLLTETSKILGVKSINPDVLELQKWRYANIAKQNFFKPLVDQKNKIAVGGDWNIQGRVESAFLSGLKIFDEII